MAHSSLHFSTGLMVALLIYAPRIIWAWNRNEKLSPILSRWILFSIVFGVLAIVPNLLRRAGLPESFCNGWWMNIFFLHPLINRIKSGGMIIGETAIASIFTLQYILILAALIKTKYRSKKTENT